MILIYLFVTFFKIGLFSFGGGYAMIPLIQAEMQDAGWIDAKEFADLVSISQITPGPIGVNAATYVGYKTAGVAGSVCATTGVFIPSFLLIIIAAHFLRKFTNNRIIESVFKGLRPATIGLIAVAVSFFAQTSIFSLPVGLENIGRFILRKPFTNPFSFRIDPSGFIVFAISFLLVARFKLSAISVIFISAILGIVLFS